MDCYRASTEILDSWDFINLPTSRSNRDPNRERSSDDNQTGACDHRCARRKLARRKESLRQRKQVESCTSLILKKAGKQGFNDYSVFSYTNIIQSHGPVHGDHGARPPAPRKPVIQVTVVPNTNTKTANKRKETLIKATTKKPQNFIKNKDVYFFVTGRNKEKIYVNTVTAQYSESRIKKNVRPTNECATINELLNINMNKCKKSITHLKNKNTNADDELLKYSSRCNCECGDLKLIRTQPVEYIKMSKNKGSAPQKTKKNSKAAEELRMSPMKESCNANRESGKRVSAAGGGGRSRIRITGRLGLDKDDKYVLKCNATLDDEPIPTFPTNQNLISMLDMNQEGKRSSRNQRDCNVQADLRCYPPGYGQTSQATQVNFEIFYPQKYNNTKVFANNDKIIQCYCANTSEKPDFMSDESGDIALKECASPVVVISVYPHPESSDKVYNRPNTTEHTKVKSPTQAECIERKTKKVTNTEEPKIKPKYTARSRSPSPAKNKEKTNTEVKKETNQRTRVNASNSKKQISDNTSSIDKNSKTKSTKMQTSGQFNSVTNKKTERPRSPLSPKSSPTRKVAAKRTKNTTGTNTEQRLTKKALVDNFTKQYTAKMNGKDTKYVNERSAVSTKHDVSNVTINVEGDNEFFNVMFHQSALDTDVTVRKTPKGKWSNFARDNDSTSLENFLLSERDGNRIHTSFSQTFLPEPDYPPAQSSTSRLSIKDSIQVCHWREEKHTHDDRAHTGHSTNRNEVDRAFLAPSSKHFQGDDCSIIDPNVRDREIREFLGIGSRGFKPPAHKSLEASTIFGRRKEVSVTYLYRGHNKRVNVCHDKELVSTSMQHTPLYHLLILNHKIKVFLKLKEPNKQPIVLTRQQYAKIKRAIYANILKKYGLRKHKTPGSVKNSTVSIGSISVKSKVTITLHYNKETQTGLDMILSPDSSTEFMKEIMNESNTLPCKLARSGEADQDSSKAKARSGEADQDSSKAKPRSGEADQDSSKAKPRSGEADQDSSKAKPRSGEADQDSSKAKARFGEADQDSSKAKPRSGEADQDSSKAKARFGEADQDSFKAKASSIHKLLDRIEGVFINSNDKHKRNSEQTEVRILYNASFNSSQKIFQQKISQRHPRKAASSGEVQCGEVTYSNQVKLSYSDYSKVRLKESALSEHPVRDNLKEKNSRTVHTIYKGCRKCHTPNLGTSACSLGPGTSKSVSEHSNVLVIPLKDPDNCKQKPKKPFLRRLLSCLAMRVSGTSAKFPVERTPKDPSPSFINSIDWYHINSSLCGIDMSSSLYDTTASFYSDHTIQPVSKIKRGFFSSVRGFLTSRRS